MNESAVQQQTRLAMARMGNQVWRNNSGACIDETGRLIRYGLGNDSAQLNKMIKSSDLIGITPVQAYTQAFGWTVLGVFTALECKASGWHMTPGDDRASAQSRFMAIVREAGGFAGFVTHPEDVARIIQRG
jgi:hypothetical protein